MSKKLRVATVFSGIGAIEFALRRLNVPTEIVFACDNGEVDLEYDTEKHYSNILKLKNADQKWEYVENLYKENCRRTNFAKISYEANYNINQKRFYQDILLLDGNDFKDKVDLFVGGSPCQSFSSVGYQQGFNDHRGNLFYEFTRLVEEIQPKVFIYENVRNVINHDGGKTWKIMCEEFERLGYSFDYAVLNAKDFGIPQNRRRLFVVGFKTKNDFKIPLSNGKPLNYIMKDFCVENCAEGYMTYNNKGEIVFDNSHKEKADEQYYLSPKVYKYVMSGGTKNFYTKPVINLDVARTLLKTMGNHHRAGVDNYVSFDGSKDLGSVRMLTQREAHRLMGFTDDYNIVVSKAQAYKQAGNSIVVDVLMEILKEIFKYEDFE